MDLEGSGVLLTRPLRPRTGLPFPLLPELHHWIVRPHTLFFSHTRHPAAYFWGRYVFFNTLQSQGSILVHLILLIIIFKSTSLHYEPIIYCLTFLQFELPPDDDANDYDNDDDCDDAKHYEHGVAAVGGLLFDENWFGIVGLIYKRNFLGFIFLWLGRFRSSIDFSGIEGAGYSVLLRLLSLLLVFLGVLFFLFSW